MGAGTSKAARRLPTKAPTTTPSGSADAAMRVGRAAAAEQAAADAAQEDARNMEYGSRPLADAPFSGEKDDRAYAVCVR